MKFKRIFISCTAICIAAILAIALCGCEDLGEYGDVEEYYSTLGDVIMIDGVTGEQKKYSVEDYFYNKESQENFLEGEDGSYSGVNYEEYVYVAIPFENGIEMDTIAMYLKSQSDVTVYINVYITREIPSNFKGFEDIGKEYETEIVYKTDDDQPAEADNEAVEPDDQPIVEQTGNDRETAEQTENDRETAEQTGNDVETDTVHEEVTEIIKIEYDDPDPATRIGEIRVDLDAGDWTSFTLSSFDLFGTKRNSVKINSGQYILLQIRNNSGVRVYDEEKKLYVDPQTNLELKRAEITMTNLMVRALNVGDGMEEQGGE